VRDDSKEKAEKTALRKKKENNDPPNQIASLSQSITRPKNRFAKFTKKKVGLWTTRAWRGKKTEKGCVGGVFVLQKAVGKSA